MTLAQIHTASAEALRARYRQLERRLDAEFYEFGFSRRFHELVDEQDAIEERMWGSGPPVPTPNVAELAVELL